MTHTKTKTHAKTKTRTLAATVAAFALLLAACGSTGDSIGTGGSLPPDENPDGLPVEPQPAPADDGPIAGVEGTLIGTANMGGVVVNPAPGVIEGFDIAESSPEQIMVRFTDHAVGCTTATAQAFGTETQVVLVLDVGVTADAASRSCLAEDVETTLTIALDEGIGGREVIVAER